MVFVKKESTTRRNFVKEVAGAAVAGVLVGLEAKATPALQAGKSATVSMQDAGVMPAKKTVEGNNNQEAARGGEQLVAVCGLYCGACPMYLATQEKDEQKSKALSQQFASGKMKFAQEDLQCDGCLGKGKLATFCRNCAIRLCPTNKTNVTRCSDCSDFPCSRITNFNNDGMQHHSEVLDNLRHIRQMGMKDWAKHEEERWHCPQCGGSIAWYDKACSRCGAKRSDRLFPLKQG